MRTAYKVGTHINLKKKEEFATFTKVSNVIFPFVVGVLAAYGAMDLMLRANGF